MRRVFLEIVVIFIFLNFFHYISYSLDDREKTQSQPGQQTNYPQPRQEQPGQRPILPPVVPSFPSTVSPTPSPHIATPSFTSNPMNIPSGSDTSQRRIQNVPSTTAQVAVPSSATVSPQLPSQPMIIGSSLAKVLQIGQDKDGTSWIEAQDEIFNETLKIIVEPNKTPIMKKTSASSLADIKIGDTINVVFNQDEEKIIATFISIMTEEDLRVIEESYKSGLTVNSEEGYPQEEEKP